VNVVIQHAREFHLSVARIWPRHSSDLPFPPPAQPQNGEAFEAFADALGESLYLYTPEQAAEHGLKESSPRRKACLRHARLPAGSDQSPADTRVSPGPVLRGSHAL